MLFRTAAEPQCPPGWLGNCDSDVCYWKSQSHLSFLSAQQTCVEMGGTLAQPDDDFQNSFVTSLSDGWYRYLPEPSGYYCLDALNNSQKFRIIVSRLMRAYLEWTTNKLRKIKHNNSVVTVLIWQNHLPSWQVLIYCSLLAYALCMRKMYVSSTIA